MTGGVIANGIMGSDILPSEEVECTSSGVRLVLNKPNGQPELVKVLGVLALLRTIGRTDAKMA